MITLADTQNKVYYYNQKTDEVNLPFVKEIFRDYLGYDFNSFVNERVGKYRKNGLQRGEAFKKTFHQAVETCIRACAAIPKYRKEIINHLTMNPGLRGGITDEMINKMKYTELSTLRTNLGLNNRGKKVKKQETAPKKTIEQAKKAVKEKTTTELAGAIIQSELEKNKPQTSYHEVEEFYTYEEAMQAYPGYTVEELAKVGVHVTDPNAKEKENRYAIINEILDYDLAINGEELTLEILADCTKEELLEIYNTARTLNRVTRRYTK